MKNPNDKVALYLDLINIDAVYAASKNKRILQDIAPNIGNLKDILFTTVDRGNSLIDNRPTCECGVTTVDHGNDEICPFCLTDVKPITERSVTPSLFMGTPYQIESFLYPYIYQSLREAFNIGVKKMPYNPMVALMGRQNPTNPIHKVVLNRMPADLIGYNNIVRDLPRFILTLVDIIFDIIAPKERGVVPKELTEAHQKTRGLLPELYHAKELAELIKHYDLPYKSSVLPVRSKLLMTLEEGTHSKTSQTTDLYARAVVYLNNMPYDESKMTTRAKANYRPESQITKFYEKYVEFRAAWYKEEGSKGGAMRTDAITARSGLVIRSVQTQNCGPHRSEDIVLPYSQAIVAFQPWIVKWFWDNKKWGTDKTIQYIEQHLRHYDELLWSVADGVVKELARCGAIAYAIRYPSIYRTSGLCSDMVGVKKDPLDRTLSMSSTAQPAMNGDYDGDEITVRFVVVKKAADSFNTLRVRAAALQLDNEGKFSHIVGIPQPTAACWGNYLRGIDQHI